MARRIERSDAFYDSLVFLDDSPETVKVVEALVHRATSQPENAPELPGYSLRAIRSRSWGRYPALRLIYSFDDWAVHLRYVERWDELSEER